MRIRIKNKTLALLATVSLGFGLTTMTSIVSAVTANPAPYPIIDVWNYGVNDGYAYSNYYVQSPNNIGSESTIKNLWGAVKDHDKKDYGWAMSSSTKSWNDVRLNAHWNYFKF